MGKRIISFKLTANDIRRARKELEDYKQDIIQKTELFRKKVAERLEEEAKSGFSGAIADEIILKGGETIRRYAQVEVSVQDRDATTVVIADGEDAVWVEFGTGVHYNGSPGSSPHPHGAELGLVIGGYGKGNGKKEVWGFYENGELMLSRGTPATMPMARAVTTVCQDIQEIAREVFG